MLLLLSLVVVAQIVSIRTSKKKIFIVFVYFTGKNYKQNFLKGVLLYVYS